MQADIGIRVQMTVCATCTDTNSPGTDGVGGGGRLLSSLEAQLEDHPFREAIDLQACRCLMACSQGCVLSVASRGKMRYLLGNLPASEDIAAQLLDFAALYSTSPTGITANHDWPGTLAMHFLGRIPPLEPAEGGWDDEGADL